MTQLTSGWCATDLYHDSIHTIEGTCRGCSCVVQLYIYSQMEAEKVSLTHYAIRPYIRRCRFVIQIYAMTPQTPGITLIFYIKYRCCKIGWMGGQWNELWAKAQA